MKVVLAGWAWLSKSELSLLQVEKIKRDLTLIPRKTHRLQTVLKPVYLYEERRDKIGVPREYFLGQRRLEHDVMLKTSEGTPINVQSNIQFRNDQEEAFGYVTKYFDTGGFGMIFQAVPGYGKTVYSCALIAHFAVTTLVLVEREFLVQQWMVRLRTFLPGVKVGRIQGPKCQTNGFDVSIGMLQSLGKKNYPQEIYDWPGFVISDEVHRVSAPTWSPVVPLFSARRRLGLSATPRRKDGMEKVFHYHIGEVKYKSKVRSAKVFVRRIFTGFRISRKTSGAPKEIKLRIMLANKERNDLIVETLVDAVKSGRKIILLSSTLKHLNVLTELLGDYKLGVSIDSFTGSWFTGEFDDEGKPKTKKRTQEELDEAAKAQVIMATYQMAQQALDIPELDTLFLASPMSDVEQAVGRIERENKNKKELCIVVDFVDDGVPEFEAAYNYRMQFYEDRGLLKKVRRRPDDG